MFNIPACALPSDEYQKYVAYTAKCATELKCSCTPENVASLEKLEVLATSFTMVTDIEKSEEFFDEYVFRVPYAGDPRWSNRTFGAVNTVQNSACLAFISAIILKYRGVDVNMEEIFVALEEGGYRKWKLANNSRTLSTPKLDVNSIKAEFPSSDPIQDCATLEDIYALYGHPVGIGGAAIAIDNIIKAISKNDNANTRISHINQIVKNLEKGLLVPMRVNNTIYHNDPERKGGHYVVLLALIHGIAIVLDSSEETGLRLLPVKQLIDAIIEDEKLISVWDLSSCEKA